MSQNLGRESSAGLGKESVYGTEVAATVWMPHQEFTLTDSKVSLTDNSGVGTRDDTLAVDIDHILSQGNFNGLVYNDQFPHMILAALGSISTASHATATGVKVHTLTPGNTLGSYTLAGKDKNASARFAGSMLNELVINGATGSYINYTSAWLGRKSSSTSNSPSYTDNLIRFRPKDVTIKYAATVDDLDEATAKTFQEFSFTIGNNIETVPGLGVETPSYYPKNFSSALTLNKLYVDTEFKDLVMGIDKKAVSIKLERSDIVIGTAAEEEDNTHPSIEIVFEPGYFAEWSREGGLDDLQTEAITYTPIRNFSASKAFSIICTTTEASF